MADFIRALRGGSPNILLAFDTAQSEGWVKNGRAGRDAQTDTIVRPLGFNCCVTVGAAAFEKVVGMKGAAKYFGRTVMSEVYPVGEGSMSSAVLENELALISNKKIKAFTGMVLELAPEFFWTASSSSTAKHHPPQSNVSGGLVNHVKGVVVIANKICDMFKIVEDQRDAVLSACILHDVVKYSDYKRGILNKQKYTTRTHDYDGAKFVHSIGKKIESESGEEIPLLSTITGCIAWHMGRWTVRNNGHAVKPFPDEYSIPEMIVHVSDCIAAIKDIHWLSLEQSLKA